MAAYKSFTIFLLLLLSQAALTKPIDDDSSDSSEEEIRENPTASQKLLLYIIDEYLLFSEEFAKGAANVTRHILKDEAFVANTKPEVIEFKKNLTTFLEKYETNEDKFLIWDILSIYNNITDKYLEVAAETLTEDEKFMLDILNKYNFKDVVTNFGGNAVGFLDNFQKMFEENKANVNKSLLDWYEKFTTLTDYGLKMDAVSDFIEMA